MTYVVLLGNTFQLNICLSFPFSHAYKRDYWKEGSTTSKVSWEPVDTVLQRWAGDCGGRARLKRPLELRISCPEIGILPLGLSEQSLDNLKLAGDFQIVDLH